MGNNQAQQRVKRQCVSSLPWNISSLHVTGILAGVVHFFSILIFSSLQKDYSNLHQAVSELGAPPSEHYVLMNVLGLAAPGLLICVFAIAVFKTLRPGLPENCIVFSIFGFGLTFALLAFPMNSFYLGDSQQTIHSICSKLSILPFVSLGFLSLTFPSAFQLKEKQIGTLQLLFLLFIASRATGEIIPFDGLTQRLLLFSIFLWFSALSAYYLLNQRGNQQVCP